MTAARSPATAVGFGRWGRNVVRALASLDALEAIVESDAGHAQACRELYPATPVFNSLDEALARTSGPFVFATPAETHTALAVRALDAGRDTFVEKPLALRAADARETANAARRNGRILMTGHLLLYRPAVEYVIRAVADGTIGRLVSISQVRKNLGTVRRVENVLLSLGVHDLAVLTALCPGDPIEIAAHGQAFLNPPIEDQMSVSMRYASGVDAQLDLSWLWPYKERRLTVIGDRGALSFDELTGEVTRYSAYADADGTLAAGDAEVVFRDGADALELELGHFLDCVARREEPKSGADQGVRVVELLERISQSLQAGRTS